MESMANCQSQLPEVWNTLLGNLCPHSIMAIHLLLSCYHFAQEVAHLPTQFHVSIYTSRYQRGPIYGGQERL